MSSNITNLNKINQLKILAITSEKILMTEDYNCRVRHLTSISLRDRDTFINFKELLDTTDIQLLNDKTPTYHHQRRYTVHDLVLIKSINVQDLTVQKEEESLTDHLYLTYKVTTDSKLTNNFKKSFS